MDTVQQHEALCRAHSVQDEMSILGIFANISEEEEIFPLTCLRDSAGTACK